MPKLTRFHTISLIQVVFFWYGIQVKFGLPKVLESSFITYMRKFNVFKPNTKSDDFSDHQIVRSTVDEPQINK